MGRNDPSYRQRLGGTSGVPVARRSVGLSRSRHYSGTGRSFRPLERGFLALPPAIRDGQLHGATPSRLYRLSEDMRTTLLIRGLPPEKIVTISNFMPGEFTWRDRRPIHNNLDKSSKIFRVIYAGKISRFQGLETMVHAARLLEREAPEVEFVVLGEGVALPNLKRLAAGLSNIRFVPHMAFEAASVLIATADLGLVSVRPGIYRAAYPSKTLTYLALGVPLLAVVDSESALARMVRRDEVGIVVEGWSGRAIADAVLAARRGPVEHWRAKAELVHRRDFSTTALLRQWDGVVERLA